MYTCVQFGILCKLYIGVRYHECLNRCKEMHIYIEYKRCTVSKFLHHFRLRIIQSETVSSDTETNLELSECYYLIINI